MPDCELLTADKPRAKGIKQDLKRALRLTVSLDTLWVRLHVREEDFSENIVQAKQFDTSRKVSIDAVLSKIFVVFNVVFLFPSEGWYYFCNIRTHLERSRIRYPYRKVGKDRNHLIRFDPLKRQIMGDLVNSQKEVVVGSTPDGVRTKQKEWRKRLGVTQPDSNEQLKRDDTEYNIFGERFMPHQLGNLLGRGNLMMLSVRDVRITILTSGCALMIAMRRVRWGSSVINHRKSLGSCGGPKCDFPSSLNAGETIVVRRGDRPSFRDSAPP